MNKYQNLNTSASAGKVSEVDLDTIIDYRGQMTADVLRVIALRNAVRSMQAQHSLGERWLLHPTNATPRKPAHVG